MRNYFLIACLLALPFTANSALTYELSSDSDPTTFGFLTVDVNVGDTYDMSDVIDWDFSILGLSMSSADSNLLGGGTVNTATSSNPFGGSNAFLFGSFSMDYISVGWNEVAILDGQCAGPVLSCLAVTGGTLQSDVNWSLNTPAVPIPSAVWLFGSGLIGLIGFAKRKKV